MREASTACACRAAEIANAKFVAQASSDLAQLLQDTNRFVEAELMMRRALDIDVAALGERHPVVANRLSALATLLQDSNRIGEAEPVMCRALEIDMASFGKQHPIVATSPMNELGGRC